MRWDSPFVLALAGTVAVHLTALTIGDAIVVTHPPRIWTPAPHLELVEVVVPPVLRPPPPPPPAAAPEPPAPAEPVKPAPRARAVRATPAPAPRAPEPPPPPAETPASGGAPVVHMDDIAPAATGVGVAAGRAATGRIGRGGIGGGTGAGAGSGARDELPRPVSIATIKTDARPKGDYGYINLGKDYPAEARDLKIEGKLRVLLIVDVDGKVASRRLINRLGHGLDELALQYAAKLEFEPARDADGNPVATQITWTFDMIVPK